MMNKLRAATDNVVPERVKIKKNSGKLAIVILLATLTIIWLTTRRPNTTTSKHNPVAVTAPAPLTPEQLCKAAGQATARPGDTMYSAKCHPDGTMCFKYDDGRERTYAFVVFPNRQTREGYMNDHYSVDDRGRVLGIAMHSLWRPPEQIGGYRAPAGGCYDAKEEADAEAACMADAACAKVTICNKKIEAAYKRGELMGVGDWYERIKECH